MKKRFFYADLITIALIFFITGSTALLGGCATEALSPDHGRSFEAMIKTQAVHPEGLPADTPPLELSGTAARAIYENYLDDISDEDSSDSDDDASEDNDD